MKRKLVALRACSAILFFGACSKDEVPDEVVPATKVTYAKDVKPVLTSSCSPCHVAGGTHPYKFDDYSVARSKISSIIDRVSRDASAPGFMPQGGSKLSASSIAMLNKWVTDGLMEK